MKRPPLKEKSILIVFLLSTSLLAIFQFPAAFAAGPTEYNHCFTQTLNSPIMINCVVNNSGDTAVIAFGSQTVAGDGATHTVVSISDGNGDVFTQQVGVTKLQVLSGRAQGTFDSELWSGQVLASGTVTFTIVFANSPSSTNIGAIVNLLSNASPTAKLTATGTCDSAVGNGACLTIQTSTTNTVNGGVAVAVEGGDGNAVGSGASFTLISTTGTGQGEFANGLLGTTNYPYTAGANMFTYAEVGAIFGASSRFTCAILNLDAGNYVVGNAQKFYKLQCMIQSSAVSATFTSPIVDIRAEFNDSNTGSCVLTCFSTALPNNVILDLKNDTGQNQASVIQGQSITTLKGLGEATVDQGINTATGVRSINVTWPFSLNGNVVNSLNRGIQLFASLANGQSRGFEYVRKNYFNIINSGQGGGSVSKLLISGACSVPSGADVFQTVCRYNASPKSWIAENATYYQLEQYQGQFALQTADAFGNPSPYYWQIFNETGAGCIGTTCPSENSGDWKIDSGLYAWDNSSATCCWVKGIHVTIQTIMGRVGSSNLWTKFAASWFNGKTLVKNDTFFAFVPSNGGQGAHGQLGFSQVNIWLNFWYSQNNGSTTQGGEVGAYYTGMHKNAYLIWTSWAPFLANNTQSQVFMPLRDHTGALMAAQQAQFTRVYMNMSRPGAPGAHTSQDNFQIGTTNFQEQEFNVASQGMTGISTPTFATAIVPTITSGGLFAPLVNAIKAIASYIVKGFQALGTLVWNALGARFPWFTGTLSSFAGFITQLIRFTVIVIGYIVQALQVIYNGLALVAYPITVIGNAWGTIQGIFGPIFTGANLNAMMIIVVLWIFAGYVIDAAEKGDTKAFIALALGGWRVVNALAYWTWLIAKFFVDAIEGLIP